MIIHSISMQIKANKVCTLLRTFYAVSSVSCRVRKLMSWVTHEYVSEYMSMLNLLILIGFLTISYSSYSYSLVFTGHRYSRTHTHMPLSTALLILTHTHSRMFLSSTHDFYSCSEHEWVKIKARFSDVSMYSGWIKCL